MSGKLVGDLTVAQIRKKYQGRYSAVGDAVIYLVTQKDFIVRDQGHGVRLYCPCGPSGIQFSVNGTPKNPSGHARKVSRQGEHCPDDHDLNPSR